MINHELQEQALKLSDIEKIHLIELLMEDLNRPSPDVEDLWVKESEERYQAFKEGKIKGIPFETIKERYSK
jgi:putative addiction module component (TIGR02574 family)